MVRIEVARICGNCFHWDTSDAGGDPFSTLDELARGVVKGVCRTNGGLIFLCFGRKYSLQTTRRDFSTKRSDL